MVVGCYKMDDTPQYCIKLCRTTGLLGTILLSDYGELKSFRMCGSGGSYLGYKLGEEVQGDYTM